MLPSPMKRMKTFGVRFSEDGGVPVLVTKCVKEINRRGRFLGVICKYMLPSLWLRRICTPSVKKESELLCLGIHVCACINYEKNDS